MVISVCTGQLQFNCPRQSFGLDQAKGFLSISPSWLRRMCGLHTRRLIECSYNGVWLTIHKKYSIRIEFLCSIELFRSYAMVTQETSNSCLCRPERISHSRRSRLNSHGPRIQGRESLRAAAVWKQGLFHMETLLYFPKDVHLNRETFNGLMVLPSFE